MESNNKIPPPQETQEVSEFAENIFGYVKAGFEPVLKKFEELHKSNNDRCS